MKKILLESKLFKILFLNSVIILFNCFEASAQVNLYATSVSTGAVLENMNGFTPLFLTGQDDVASTVQNIGFNFTFNNIIYSQFSTNSNGLMRLGATVISNNAVNNLIVNSDFPKIAPYWDDLTTGTTGYCGYKLIGTSPNRKLAVEFILNVPKSSTTNAGKFQVWLFETTNVIQFVYNSGLIVNAGAYSVGLATSTTDFWSVTPSASTASFSSATSNNSNTAAITSGVSYTFTPPLLPPSCVSASIPVAGSTGISSATALSWTAGTGNPTSYDVYFGTSSNPPLVSTSQVSTTYTPTSTLGFNTVYYYKVVPKNATGSASGCSINSFTTAPSINYNVVRNTGISYSSILSTGTVVTGWKNGTNTDDNLSVSQPIGFNFNYQGKTYSSFLVSTNGFITFNTTTALTGNGSGAYSYTNSLTMNAGPLIIAPFYEDLVCQGNAGLQSNLDASIRYTVSGVTGSRIFIIEWLGMEIYNNAGPNFNFQLKLYEATSEIENVYGSMEPFNGTINYVYSYTIGINGVNVSATPLAGEYFNQLTANTRNFGTPGISNLTDPPTCATSLKLSPGSYLSYVATTIIPSNDLRSSPQHLDVGSSPCTDLCGSYFSSVNATATPSLVACAGGNADDDVWFEFTATNSNTTIKVMGSGNYDPAVELYNSSNVLVACKDSSGSGLTEYINSTNLILGQQYFLRIYHNQVGAGTGSGQFAICVSATPVPPINDNCSSAISLPVTTANAFTTGSQTIAATTSASIPLCSLSGTTPDDDVWYSFVATYPIEIITVNSGNGFNAVIQLFSNSCGSLNSLQCVNTYGNGQQEVLTASTLTVGQTYFIRVYHAGVGGGTGLFSINVTTSIPTCASTMIPQNATSFIPHTGSTLKWSKIPNISTYRVYLDFVNPPTQVLINTTDTFALTGTMQQGANYYWSVVGVNVAGISQTCNINAFATEPLEYSLKLKVFLEGLYLASTHKMVALLNPADTLADSITVNLINPVTKLVDYSSKGVVSVFGNSNILFPQPALGQNYYIAIKNRNSLEVWSSVIFGFNTPDTLYDFTIGATKAYGSNQILVEPGVYALHTGDLNQDGAINFNDFNVENSSLSSGYYVGYYPGDINGDGIIESTDYSWIENKTKTTFTKANP